MFLCKISGSVVPIWDGSPIHRAHELRDFLKRWTAKRLHLEQLPGYAPDLDQLHRKLIQTKEPLRHKKEIIKRCSRQCGYSV